MNLFFLFHLLSPSSRANDFIRPNTICKDISSNWSAVIILLVAKHSFIFLFLSFITTCTLCMYMCVNNSFQRLFLIFKRLSSITFHQINFLLLLDFKIIISLFVSNRMAICYITMIIYLFNFYLYLHLTNSE